MLTTHIIDVDGISLRCTDEHNDVVWHALREYGLESTCCGLSVHRRIQLTDGHQYYSPITQSVQYPPEVLERSLCAVLTDVRLMQIEVRAKIVDGRIVLICEVSYTLNAMEIVSYHAA